MEKQFENIGDGLLVRAPAKINLSLLVAGKRPDGYHELETIMAKINWYDEILIEPGREKGIELICKGPYEVPEGEDNLVYKAAKLILETGDQGIRESGKQGTGVKDYADEEYSCGDRTGVGQQ